MYMVSEKAFEQLDDFMEESKAHAIETKHFEFYAKAQEAQAILELVKKGDS